MTNSRVLTVAGMHRSGSSLTASWLASAGLFMGECMLEGGRGNFKGHFEDIEILKLHEKILADNKLDYRVGTDDQLSTSEDNHDDVRAIIKKKKHEEWGWKEPRTALFLPMWKKGLPSLKLLVIFRSYSAVADSLLRRERMKKSSMLFWRRYKYSFVNPVMTRRLLSVWARYNEDILAMVDKYPDDSLVFHIDDIVDFSSEIAALVNSRWGFHLNPVDIHSVFDSKLLKKDTSKFTLWNDFLSPQCPKIYGRLENWRSKSLQMIK